MWFEGEKIMKKFSRMSIISEKKNISMKYFKTNRRKNRKLKQCHSETEQ